MVPAYSSTVVANATYIESLAEKGEPFRGNMQAVTYKIVSSRALISSINEARTVDVVLRLIRAQRCVVRREARTRSCCRVRWCRTERTCFTSSWSGITTESNCSGLDHVSGRSFHRSQRRYRPCLCQWSLRNSQANIWTRT